MGAGAAVRRSIRWIGLGVAYSLLAVSGVAHTEAEGAGPQSGEHGLGNAHPVAEVQGPQAGLQDGLSPGEAAPTRAFQEVDPDGYTSARVCGECHTDIYDSWKNSLHAFSLTDPIFDTAYMQAVKVAGDEARRLCLGCHAPMTTFNGDYKLELGVTREGVSCDFCHTVTAVHLEATEKRYSIAPGLVKRGIIKRAASPAHAVEYSELHGTAEFCGGCHNYVSPAGATIMSTYDEWREGPYAAEGTQCQNCHMVLSEGQVVDERIKESRDRIHLHSLIHDSDQLRGALSVEITRSQRRSGAIEADVVVANVGSGHMVPTGMPTREVVLTVSAEGARRTQTAERRYRRVFADADGRPLERDFEILLYGARMLNDTRIAPREERLERFSFDAPRSGPVELTATLTYYYAPAVLGVQRMEIRLGTSQRTVR